MRKHIKIPSPPIGRVCSRNRRANKKRQRTPAKVSILIDPGKQIELPTLLFRRRYPTTTYIVPPLSVPLYWFDSVMVKRGWLLPIPPDTFVVDGRRFKALAQDQHTIGRQPGYTRWLVYEEAAVPKGDRP